MGEGAGGGGPFDKTSPRRGGPFGAVIFFVGSASPPTGHGRRDACPTFYVLYPISTKFWRYRFPKSLRMILTLTFPEDLFYKSI